MRKLLFFTGLITVIFGGVLVFREDLTKLYSDFFTKLPDIEKEITGIANEIQEQIIAPPPLKFDQESPNAFLTKSGVMLLTNAEREKQGLSPLKENKKLNASAKAKLEDLFKNQYFEHVSPSGVGVGELAKEADYEFIIIGENLAMGNFANDAALIQGWMDSPGHKANILNPRYREIGVAVLQGIFDGRTTWIAVQHFGTPISICPTPPITLKSIIDSNQALLDQMRRELDSLRIQISESRPRSSQYQQLVQEYNDLVSGYNNLIQETKYYTEQYNQKVADFNTCVSSLN